MDVGNQPIIEEWVQNRRVEYPAVPFQCDSSDEWTYTMRRSMQEIVPGLYLGPYSAAVRCRLKALLAHGVTHIVCVRQAVEAHFVRPNFPDQFKYLVLDIADSPNENIIQHFGTVRQFIDEGLNAGGKVLVHGNAGISRSAALVLAYVMEKYGLSCSAAFGLVQQRRFCINPNEGFLAQLTEFEPIYRAQQTLRNGEASTPRFKRPLDDAGCEPPPPPPSPCAPAAVTMR
ncbi:serine/threonine/tyrosine-interacting protein-like [Schistocerca americana]|uniref:serine/threonine/tyrosine-interacting protein-like n=2 Tax=Schistocerca TaxID=7008 RepID=UPI001F4F6255|nr:serine/threonine/tyrosine-interacting protein-like [Schistocerca americana]XP_047099456.1 serine/threonine/tyrosine-interacting protein-like isoform X1 [Schistocerca piceifrons]XP_049769282.1 serine/threonine/tyrosine-interacting protein-like [Schistocerca cancellata]XP_049795675.1 serine/threonine/tyrosine-interacting protein-like isoform X1 [Schistocerca nitens]XP_049841982.1 serine/threonine/tyrosine-interacting protein-like [Schistocerca gregaria]